MRYRDTKTGKFVSAATWRRSRSHGGTRYRRVSATRTGPRGELGKVKAVAPVAPPRGAGGGGGAPRGTITGPIPAEFLLAADEYFESGYEYDFEEEDEYY